MSELVQSESPPGSPTFLMHRASTASIPKMSHPPAGITRRPRVVRYETQLAVSPERVLETNASITTIEDHEEPVAFSTLQNRTVSQHRMLSVDSDYEQRRTPKRTQTIFNVLDLDHQTQGEFFAGTTLLAPVEEGYKPYGEERRTEGTEIFLQFETDTLQLFQTLLVFHNSVRSLGSTFTLLKAADVLRTDLLMLLTLFRNSASEHLKGLSQSESRLTSIRNALSKRQEQEGRWTQKKYVSPKITSIPKGLDRLAYALSEFLARLNEVSEFAEENMNLVVDRCIQEIRYRASTLRDFESRMLEADVALYANDVAGLLGDQLAAVEAALKIFIEDGVVNIRRSQDRAGGAFQNLSTVSTLLSAVTATAIQFTYNNNGSRLASRTNMLWIISLSFSIASAIHSQLAYYWIRHSHRTPSLNMSAFGSLIIVRAPFAFFVVSTIAFSGGLIAFSFLVFNSSTIHAVAVICTSITIGAMVLVVIWLAGEKSELLWLKVRDSAKSVKKGISRCIPSRLAEGARPAATPGHTSASAHRDLESHPHGEADVKDVLHLGRPGAVAQEPEKKGSLNERFQFAPVKVTKAVSSALGPSVAVSTAVPMFTFASDQAEDEAVASDMDDEAAGVPPDTIPNPVRPLPPTVTLSPLPSLKATPSDNSLSQTQWPPNDQDIPTLARESFRLSDIKQALQQRRLKKCAFKLQPFDSAVRRIAFSPDGRFLASCAWEPSVEVWKLDLHHPTDPILSCHCPESSVVNDVVWCPDSTQQRFLALCGEAVTLWQVEGLDLMQANSITLTNSAHRVVWMPDGNRFVAVNESKIHVVDVNSGTLESSSEPISINSPNETSIIDIAIPNQQIAWVIVDIKKTAEQRVPLGAPERRLLGWAPPSSALTAKLTYTTPEIELSSGEIKHQLPFIHPVKDIVASSDNKGIYGVLAFSNKASSLLIKRKAEKAEKPEKPNSSLKISRPFLTTAKVDTAGRTSMGSLCAYGALNQIVVGADRGGKVYFWDRKTATRLHEMNTEHEAPGLAHAVWNHASSTCLMLATATDDGHICLWYADLPRIADYSRT